MKKLTFILAFVLIALASCTTNKVNKKPVETLTLKFKSTKGTNACVVVYNPQKHLYYTAIAGNQSFPIETFNQNGEFLNTATLGFDLRGLWWNTKENTLQSNAYSDLGLNTLKLTEGGTATDNFTWLTNESHQPDDNSVGAYNAAQNQILYYNNGLLYKVDASSYNQLGSIPLSIPVSLDNINQTTVIYTGIKHKEVGVLNFEDKKVYLFDINSGKLTATINLPANAVTFQMFRFSYANGYVWLYDIDVRMWTGYKIVK